MYLLPLCEVEWNEYRHRFRLCFRKLFRFFVYLSGRYSQNCSVNFFSLFYKMYKTALNLIIPFLPTLMGYCSFILFYWEGLFIFDCMKKIKEGWFSFEEGAIKFFIRQVCYLNISSVHKAWNFHKFREKDFY